MSTSDVDGVCEDLEACKLGKISDEELFKQPPTKEDCPICFQQLPLLKTGYRYMTCCGKVICCGCLHAPLYDDQGNKVDNNKCPFCRTPYPATNEEMIERQKKRVEANDPIATYNKGNWHFHGTNGCPQDYAKALELFHRAGELGHVIAYNNIGHAYNHGRGVEQDKKKAIHYWELAAIRGDVLARRNLGREEFQIGNVDRSIKHFMVAVKGGDSNFLNEIKQMYSNGQATKEDYTIALRLYQEYLGEIKSNQRDEAAAFCEKYRYY